MEALRVCNVCKIEAHTEEDLEFFKKSKSSYYGRQPLCKICANKDNKKYRKESFFTHRCSHKKAVCKKYNILFDITPKYLESIWTGRCAIFNTPISYEDCKNFEQGAQLDRITPNKGYTIDNVAWVSFRANFLKRDSTIEELSMILKYMENR